MNSQSLPRGFLEALGAGAWGELRAKGRLKEVSPDQWPQMRPVSSFAAVPTHGTLRKPCSQSKPQEDIQISLCKKRSLPSGVLLNHMIEPSTAGQGLSG